MVPGNIPYILALKDGSLIFTPFCFLFQSKQPVDCAAKNKTLILCDRLGNPFLQGTRLSFKVKLQVNDPDSSTNILKLYAKISTYVQYLFTFFAYVLCEKIVSFLHNDFNS